LKSVFTRAEVPRLFLWIIVSLFKPFEFIFKVDYVISLFIAEGCVSISCKYINHILLFGMLNFMFSFFIIVDLCDRVV
jgi:hypothetical protein